MFHRTLLWLLIAGSTIPAFPQPFVFYHGIVNATSYAPPGLPNGPIARGSVFSVFGRNFGPAQPAQVSQFPLSTTLAGVGVSVCQNGACVSAIPLFVSAGQVNAIMPSNAPLGPVSLRIVFNGQGGYYASATVAASSFGAFSVNGAGFGPGSVQNFLPDGSLPINSATTPARPGQTVILWGTGLGAGLNADTVAPQAGDLPVDVEIWVGGKKVTVKRYSGRSPCCAGVDQLAFDLPSDTPAGCSVPVQVRTGRQTVSNSVSIAVSSDGAACSDSFNPLSAVFRAGGKIGLVFANRFNALQIRPDGDAENTVEFAIASFRREAGGPFAYNALASLPPPGSCVVHAVPGDFFGGAIVPAFRASGAELDAGATLSMGGTAVGRSTYYSAMLAGTLPSFRKINLPTTLLDRPLRVQGAGGPDVPPFTLDVPAASAVRWTDRAAGAALDRAGGLRVNWDGGDSPGSIVVVAGVNPNAPENASAAFLCTALPAAKSFAIPPYILQGLPASAIAQPGEFRFGYIMVGALTGATSTPPAGFDAAIAVSASWSARAVQYR